KIDLAGQWTYSLDNEAWKEIRIPASIDYKGRITFVRKFTLDRATIASSSIQLVAFGVNHEAEVFLNDAFVGRHVGGYTTMKIDLPENALQLGSENALKIVVNNSLSSKYTLPLRQQIWGWRNYNGILRDIYLLITPKLWVDRLQIHSELNADRTVGTLKVTGILNSKLTGASDDSLSSVIGSSQPLFVVELADKSTGAVVAQSAPQAVSVPPNRDYEVSTTLSVKSPRLWSPESPDEYVLRGKIILQQSKQGRLIDEFDCVTGFRQFSSDDGSFVLNGKPVTLRGVVWHEDAPRHGASLTYEQMEKDIALIKTLGANAVRFAFHPPHPYVLSLCDKYGLMAFVELPAWCVPGEILGQDQFRTLAETMVGEVIERDQHWPSVVAWGLGDGFDSDDPRTCGYVERVAAAAKKLDDRPLYFGSYVSTSDLCGGKLDFAGIHLRPDAGSSLKSSIVSWKDAHPHQPVVVLSYAKSVEPDNRNGWSDPMSQEAQAEYLKKAIQTIKDAGIAGSFIDAFADWRGDRPIMSVGVGDRTIHPVGLLSASREKRASFDMVRLLYNGEKTTALPIGRYRATFPVAHILWGFAVIFVIAYLYHYNRRFNETFKRSLIRSYNFYADLRDIHTVSIPQTFALAAGVAVTMAVIISGILYRYRTDMLADQLLTVLVVWDGLKEKLIAATWHPFTGILVFSIGLMLVYPLIAFCIRLFAFFVKRRVLWYHAFAVAVWGSLPIVLLSPVAMAYFKLLQTDFNVLPAFSLVGAFLLWSLFRILKGVSVIYDISRLKAYAGGILLVLVILGGVFVYYETTFALSAYIEFFFHIGRSIS
ncbi:MAG TPA: glycoside hydrolase family 2 TIM barrel-domain containing protein, partial [Bacteroidota bacterium]|nr:glycoside hydrolase family 2 TIM barrel-domain containing protein [Bacteroidota bacterium]